ncbi:SpoIIE family protein phosphatase [Motiliproteus sp.]|uniref:SpoIIE family protein phosphatase n=1 Tax=Motiliproteus sp. TaxID=1898955 RepID=UPI003BAADEE1
MNLDSFALCRPFPGEAQSGDLAVIEQHGEQLFLGLIDVAGHGPKAHALAVECGEYLRSHLLDEDLTGLLQGLHRHIRYSRGAVAGLALLDASSGELNFAGVGNIYACTLGRAGRTLISRSGLLGQIMPSVRQEHTRLRLGELLVLCSDGVHSRDLETLFTNTKGGDAKNIATELVERFGKDTDDASCIVVRRGAAA